MKNDKTTIILDLDRRNGILTAITLLKWRKHERTAADE